MPVVFPLHPRTRAKLAATPADAVQRLRIVEPLNYLDFIALQAAARLVITDSGGVQEETSALGTPCLTYRDSTERAITIEHGTNRLIGVDPHSLAAACAEELARPRRRRGVIPLWDGAASVLQMLNDRAKDESARVAA